MNRNPVEEVRRLYVRLWKYQGDIDNIIMTNTSYKDKVFARSTLQYLRLIRSEFSDFRIKGCEVYYANTSDQISDKFSAVLLYWQEWYGKLWMYFYTPSHNGFFVLKDNKNISGATNFRIGVQLRICTKNGSLLYATGINKLKRRAGKRARSYKISKTVIEYYISKGIITLPCADKNLADTLLKLRLVPPLIVQLPPNGTEKWPRLGLILPIDVGEKVSVGLYDISQRNPICINCINLSGKPPDIEKNQVNCIDMVKYLKETLFHKFLSELRHLMVAHNLNEVISSEDNRPLQIALKALRQFDSTEYEEFYSLWQRERKGISKAEFLRYILTTSGHVEKYLQYIISPKILKYYDIIIIEEIFLALNRLLRIII